MPSCAGTFIVTVCRFTFCIRSTIGMITVRPGGRTAPGRSRSPRRTCPNRNTMPCSYCCTTLTADPAVSSATKATTKTMVRITAITGTFR